MQEARALICFFMMVNDEYLWMMGLFFTLKILEWELERESPDVGIELLVQQPLNYSHTEFAGGLHH